MNAYDFRPKENKNIIICCDGTWNSPDQTDEGRTTPTNVARLYDNVIDVGEDSTSNEVPQLKWYDMGVGAGLGLWGKLLNYVGARISTVGPGLPSSLGKLGVFIEGGLGLGIAQNVREAYTWLCKIYQPGDRIFLFGFSRGAFTVRSLSGMIYHVGLLKSEYIGDVSERFKCYRQWRDESGESGDRDPARRWSLRKAKDPRIHDTEALHIHFMGLWDTVAALGIPMWGWSFEVFRIKTSYHDGSLVPIVDHAYHALAMDELRSSFMPTLLDPPVGGNCHYEQRWFRGAHADIGGGYSRSGLSDIPFDWILTKAMECGLRVRGSLKRELNPDPLGLLHDEVFRNKAYAAAGTWPRMFPVAVGGNNAASSALGEWHDSVVARSQAMQQLDYSARLRRLPQSQGWDWIASNDTSSNGITAIEIDPHPVFDPRERAWRTLEVGDTVCVRIRADQTWCLTGVILEKDRNYRLTAEGKWTDLGDLCGPDGHNTWDCYNMGVRSALHAPVTGLSSLIAWPLRLIFALFFSVKALTWWAKRVVPGNWMELIGMINEPTNWKRRIMSAPCLLWYLIFDDPADLARRQFRIGGGTTLKAITTGPLYCFANDLWITYGNNGGSILLTINRLSDEDKVVPPAKGSDMLWGVLSSIPMIPIIGFLLALSAWGLYWAAIWVVRMIYVFACFGLDVLEFLKAHVIWVRLLLGLFGST